MRVAIFGGIGFIGRAIAKTLLEHQDKVYIADNWSVIPEEDPPKGAFKSCVDVRDPSRIGEFLTGVKPDIVFWLAARQGYYSDYSSFATTNINGVYAFFEAIEENGNRPKVILASSQAVYAPGLDRTEESDTAPPSVYGFSKLQQERAFKTFCEWYSMPLIVLRYSIVLGPGQSLQSSESGVLRNWWRAYRQGISPRIYGDGRQIRDFVHVDDVTEANLLAVDYGESGLFNIGGDRASIINLFRAFQRATGCKDAVHTKAVRPGGEYSMTSQSLLAHQKLGWQIYKAYESQVEDFVDSRRHLDENAPS